MASQDAELAAVEAALNTLALADTDRAFEKVVAKLLPGLLSALSTNSKPARAKCIETLQHINVRLRAAPSVALPFLQVLDVASAPNAAVMTRNVAIQGGYVSRCFARYPEKASAFVRLVSAAATVVGDANKNTLFTLATRALNERVAQRSAQSSLDAQFLHMLDHIEEEHLNAFLRYGLSAMQGRTKEPTDHAELLALVTLGAEYAGVKKPERAVKVFPILIVAAGDTSRSAVSSAAEDALKRIDTCDVLLEHDPSLVQKLFDMFLYSGADVPLRCLLLSKGLLRATLSASCFPEVLSVIQESVYQPGIPPRLRSLGMQYVSFVVRNGTEESLRENGVALVQGMLKVIRDQTDGSPSFTATVRGFAYTALSEILLRIPTLLAQHAHLTPELYFTAAQSSTESPEVRSAASQALSLLAPVFSVEKEDASSAFRGELILETLRRTIQNLDACASSARFAAILWANQCFAFRDASARIINVIGCGDDRPDVREAAIAGLSSKRYRGLASRVSFEARENSDNRDAAVNPKRPRTEAGGMPDDGRDSERMADVDYSSVSGDEPVLYPSIVDLVNAFKARVEGYDGRPAVILRPKSWAAFLRFSLLTLKRNALMDMDKTGSGASMYRRVSPGDVRKFLSAHDAVRPVVDTLRSFADQFLLERDIESDANLDRAALQVVLFSAEVDEEAVARRYAPHFNDIVALCARKSAVGAGITVEGLARLSGLAAISLPAHETQKVLSKFVESIQPDGSGRPSPRHGEDNRAADILCAGYVIAAMCERKILARGGSTVLQLVAAVSRRLRAAVDPSLSVRMAACHALSVMGVQGPLPLPWDAADMPEKLILPSRESVLASLCGIIDHDQSEPKLVEAAATAVGRICVGEPRRSLKRRTIQSLLNTTKHRKEDEVHFTAAECLVRAAVGFDAPPPRPLIREEDATVEEGLAAMMAPGVDNLSCAAEIVDDNTSVAPATDVRSVVVRASELCFNERPYTRSGACVMLVTFLRLVGTPDASKEKVGYEFKTPRDEALFRDCQDQVSASLSYAQRAFTTLLADRSDFCQHLASRGVSLVYDMSTEREQKDLVSGLVRSLTMGKQRAGTTVAGDEGGLLDINGLPQPGTSSSSSSTGGAATYKELCSLATDMGQPELVYKFLDLASHAALWNNRRGAALAGDALLEGELAAKQLRPHVATLIPRLYVYCYDPAEGVRMAMSSVMQSVAKASGSGTVAEAVTEHFDSVAEHCLVSMSARQWRVREAGCAALRDLMSSRRWNEVADHLKQFWYITLRAMDDIKETVRKAAGGTGRAVSALSIRLCDPALSGASAATAAVAIVVPSLLSTFTHAVDEVRLLASKTLTEVIRHGGRALKPSVPSIMDSLLESATELEPIGYNYVSFHIDADQRNQLDEARQDAASMSSSPVIDALERLSIHVDEEIVAEVVSVLTRLARMGVGVPTRAATARIFCTLLSSRGVIMEPYARKLMVSAMSAARMEANGQARKAWSNAFGLAARLASDEPVAKMASVIAEMSGSDSTQDRTLASFLACGLWHNSAETARKHATALLPIAYMGRYDGDEEAKGAASNWKEVWSEGSPSTEAGLRLYASEITAICIERLKVSQQYKVKRSSAVALGALAAAHTSSVATENLALAAKALVESLSGHIWDGKEAVLTAIGTIAGTAEGSGAAKASALWADIGGSQAVVSALLHECLRGKKEYRLCALDSLAKVLDVCRDDEDYVMTIISRLEGFWSGEEGQTSRVVAVVARSVLETGDDADAVDARNKARKAERTSTVSSIGCLTASFPSRVREEWQARHFGSIVTILGKLVQSEREVKAGALEYMAKVVSRVHPRLMSVGIEVSAEAKEIVFAGLAGSIDTRYSGVREAGYQVLLSAVEATCAQVVGAIISSSQETRVSLQRTCRMDSGTSARARRLEEVLALHGGFNSES